MTSRTQKILIGVAIGVVVCLFVLGVLIGAAVIGWKTATRAGNEAATIQNLKTIAAVEAQYFSTKRTFGTFDQIVKENMLSKKFSSNPVVADGYVLTLTLTPRTAKLDSSYSLAADPLDSSTGTNHFYLDSGSGQIHFNKSGPAGPDDPILDNK